MNILLTTTSFQDTPGKHHQLLQQTGFNIEKIRGPVKENVLLPIIANFDAVICGDDEFSRKVIEKGAKGKLKVISKYGIGLDKIDLDAAKAFNIPVYNTPGVNHITVAEHTISLILTYLKNVHLEYELTKNGMWKRMIGSEIYGKKIGILGLGRIGKEFAKRIHVFGVQLYAYDINIDYNFAKKFSITIVKGVEELILNADILSIHAPLTEKSKSIINDRIVSLIKKPIIIVNTSRALILDQGALLKGLEKGKIKAYLTDVLDQEPMPVEYPLAKINNVIITPHIGSRTFESVERQGLMAVNNLIQALI